MRDTKAANLHTFKPRYTPYFDTAENGDPMNPRQEAEAEAQLSAQFHDKMVAEIEADRPGKIAILGSASSSAHLAPFDDKSWEIWNLAWRVNDVPRNDVLFEIHRRDQWLSCQGGVEEVLKLYTGFLQNTKIPVYLYQEQPDIPSGVRFPMAECNAIAGLEYDYYASSIGYMLALAALKKSRGRPIEEVGVWGVDLLCEDEFAEQRPNAEFWLGILRGMGVKLTIPKQSAMLKANHVYGVDNTPTQGAITIEWLDKHLTEHGDKQNRAAIAKNTTEGAAQFAYVMSLDPSATDAEKEREWLSSLALTAEQRGVMSKQHDRLLKRHQELNAAVYTLEGGKQFAGYCKAMVQHYVRGGVIPG